MAESNRETFSLPIVNKRFRLRRLLKNSRRTGCKDVCGCMCTKSVISQEGCRHGAGSNWGPAALIVVGYMAAAMWQNKRIDDISKRFDDVKD